MAGELRSRARYIASGLVSMLLVIALSGCSAAVASHWLVAEDGRVSFGYCNEISIDSLTLTTDVNVGDDFSGDPVLIELSGPAITLAEGETFDLSKVAQGWNSAANLDMETDWYQLEIDGYLRGEKVLLASVDRVDLGQGEWTQVPQPGLNVVGCDRV